MTVVERVGEWSWWPGTPALDAVLGGETVFFPDEGAFESCDSIKDWMSSSAAYGLAVEGASPSWTPVLVAVVSGRKSRLLDAEKVSHEKPLFDRCILQPIQL